MEEANLFINNHSFLVYTFLFVFICGVTGLLSSVRSRQMKLKKKYELFTQGRDVNIDTVLTETLEELKATKAELAALQKEHAKLHEQVQGCLQTVKISRYDAFEAMGGEMSYSILLTDAKNDGLMMTSIYGRAESRNYAKEIKKGKSDYPLAEEEAELLK